MAFGWEKPDRNRAVSVRKGEMEDPMNEKNEQDIFKDLIDSIHVEDDVDSRKPRIGTAV